MHSMWGVEQGLADLCKGDHFRLQAGGHSLLLGMKSQAIEKGKHGYVRWLHKMGHVS